MANISEKVTSLIKETVESQKVSLWDVRFVKEGADWFLRVYIDSENGISIDDCVNVSRAIDPIIDEADPIDSSYCLEVCSPGIERELIKEEHFNKMIGRLIKVKLYKAVEGTKEFTGELLGYDGGVEITQNGEKRRFEKDEIASVRLADFE